MIKHLLSSLSLFLLFTNSTIAQEGVKKPELSVAECIRIIESFPDSIPAHEAYIKALGADSVVVEKQYITWSRKFPNSFGLHFAYGHALAENESPKAKPWLLKAVLINPKAADAYFDLSLDADRWGDFKESNNYLLKARDADPENAAYAFYYANSFSDTDKDEYRKQSLEVANRFPKSERGAQSLYWLAFKETDTVKKIALYERLQQDFLSADVRWAEYGMDNYYDLLLITNPAKAVSISQMMIKRSKDESGKKSWTNNLETAQNVQDAKVQLSQKHADKAVAILEKTSIKNWSMSKPALEILKAEALDASGKTAVAYGKLKLFYASEPDPALYKPLLQYGSKLNKSVAEIDKDIWFVRDTMSKPATPFDLKKYIGNGSISLDDCKGKVVLITYWFPGCGPCRGEFPHFENVVRKFRNKDFLYVGINIVPEQNAYVVPFMKSSHYSFIPIEDFPDRKKGNLDNRGAAPVNFLLDQKGNIVFSRFRTNEHNEQVLEEMISSLLRRGK